MKGNKTMRKNLLTQNSKMKKSTGHVYNWTIPAFSSLTGLKTCPNAGICASFCYASKGAYTWSNVRKAHERNLAISLTNDFVPYMNESISRKRNINNLRIHDAGDFYNLDYLAKWVTIMSHYPDIKFYAYTKQIEMFQIQKNMMPPNFTVIYSEGGKQDHLIDTTTDRHARIFDSLEELLAQGYVDATNDDTIAHISSNHRIGLLKH